MNVEGPLTGSSISSPDIALGVQETHRICGRVFNAEDAMDAAATYVMANAADNVSICSKL